MARPGGKKENDPASRPIALLPPGPLKEESPDNDAFWVEVVSPSQILQALQSSTPDKPIVVAMDFFAPPIDDIKVILRNNHDGTFDLRCFFNSEMMEKLSLRRSHYNKIFARLESTFGAYIFGHNGACIHWRVGSTEFVIDSREPEYGFDLNTSGMYMGRQLIRKGPAPLLDKKTFADTLRDMVEAIQFVVNQAYAAAHKQPGQAKLTISPPASVAAVKSQPKAGREICGGEINVTLDDVGGNAEAVAELHRLVVALQHPQVFQQWGTKPPKGIIFHGPPGTGKTLMARALAKESRAHFIAVNVTDIYNMWVGNSGKNMKKIFDEARKQSGPVILFFDEFDGMFGHRDYSHEVTQQVLNVFLQNLSGLDENPNITVIAATNRLTAIDPAILRSGRFDRKIEVPLPDQAARQRIFEIHINRTGKRARRRLFRRLQWPTILAATRNWSGADIESVLLQVLNFKAERQATTGKSPALVSQAELLQAIKGFTPGAEGKRKPTGFRGAREDDISLRRQTR